MASAQVLPSSRKKEHLEAGKRRLEEFRKKKAAEKAKKAANTTQAEASNVSLNDKQQLETEQVRVIESGGAGTSDGPDLSSVKIINNYKTTEVYSNNMHALPSFLANDYNSSSTKALTHATSQENEKYGASYNAGPLFNDSLPTEHMRNAFQEPKSKEDGYLKVPTNLNPISSEDFVSKISQNSRQSKASEGSLLGSSHGPSLYEDFAQFTSGGTGFIREVGQNLQGTAEFEEAMISDFGERKFSSSSTGFPSLHVPSIQTSGSSELSFDARSSPSYTPLHSVTSDTSSRRSRPSFLDSLHASGASSGSLFQHNQPKKDAFAPHSSQVNSSNAIGSTPFEKPSTESGNVGTYSKLGFPGFPSVSEDSGHFSAPASNNGDLLKLNVGNENILEKKHEFYSTKQNEDFAALEQHIEDLTQEKFSLQRALEASRALAESLASENSSLTDSYNQQRGVVNQLKSDMEHLQEEIKAQVAELESFKLEYANARLECNAADERANILASEVIGLEEKALRLRSNELKLERQLENSQSEISSIKKKMSSLEKDRQDLLSTIEALQEEKKVLQSKLKDAFLGGKPVDAIKNPASKKDMSTSTEDLASTDTTSDDKDLNTSNDASTLSLLPEDGGFEVSSVYIPPDQMRMIQNINSLISELTMEKEELTQALSSELSQSSKLKELNEELSRKLELQTQRLELLTAQSLASENIPARQPEPQMIHDVTPYADEGDEVVERVLGWIMKLFPGGPSRRRPNKRFSY
ncbi:protein BLISTER-like isoform X1 [Hibiscus syriacus]|uniref:protein BLISTER-like isoform X1 n=1 Tax=Hibiscus syriacus TaxID=106335 RepID=UPI0019215609|nr:protein BLISTER-like isoform X1 [Hibiscus syriacus]